MFAINFLLRVNKYIMFVFLLEIEGERACFGGGYLSLLQCLKGSSGYLISCLFGNFLLSFFFFCLYFFKEIYDYFIIYFFASVCRSIHVSCDSFFFFLSR